MGENNTELMHNNAALLMQLEQCNAENKRLESQVSKAAGGLSNDDLHQFNNIAALLDANIELALHALQTLPESQNHSIHSEIAPIENFLTAAQCAKTELVDIVNK